MALHILGEEIQRLRDELKETCARLAAVQGENERLRAQQLSLLGHVLIQIEMDEDSASHTSAAGQTLRAYFNGLTPDPLDLTLEAQSDAK